MTWTAHAEVLADTTEMGAEIALMAGRCRATGLDPRSFSLIMRAAMALGSRPWHIMDCPYVSDEELIEDLLGFVHAVYQRQQAYVRLWSRVANARAWAIAAFTAAQCHEPPDYAGMRYWRAVWADCDTALEVLAGLPRRLRVARNALTMAPAALGDTYQAVYDLREQGRVMPYNGRWITGETAYLASTGEAS